MDEQRFVLGIAYQAGRDPRIKKGADGARDFFTPDELEKAAWEFSKSSREIGLFHVDGTEGAGQVTESYIYRGPDWVMKNIDGDDVVVKSGDWLLGAVLDERSWNMFKSGKLTGWSPQGSGRRRTPVEKSTEPEPTPVATGPGVFHIHIHAGSES